MPAGATPVRAAVFALPGDRAVIAIEDVGTADRPRKAGHETRIQLGALLGSDSYGDPLSAETGSRSGGALRAVGVGGRCDAG